MRRINAVLPALAALALLAPSLHAQTYDDIAGGWAVASWTSAEGEMNDAPQLGVFVFTSSGHYSMMYVNTPEPRADLPEEPSDADILAAYASLTANAGRYRIDGNQLIYEAYVAKHPNYMSAWDAETEGNAVTVTMSMADGMLTLQWEDGRMATLRRARHVSER